MKRRGKLCLLAVFALCLAGPARAEKPRLVLMLARADEPRKDCAAMTLGWMCREAGAEFDVYYAADHKEGGLFSQHGSSVIGGHHAERIGRALAQFRTTVVRLGGVAVFDSLVRGGADKVVEAPASLTQLYQAMAAELGVPLPTEAVAFGETGEIPPAAYYPECAARKALAVALGSSAEGIGRLAQAGVKTVWTVAPAGADVSAWRAAGLDVKVALDLSAGDPVLEEARRWAPQAAGFDTPEPLLASYLLPLSLRENRLMLCYAKRSDGPRRRDQLLSLTEARPQDYAFGRWYGDPELLPLARRPMAYNVTEPNRCILTVFAKRPAKMPQPARSCFELEPSDDQLRAWAQEGKVLATWVLHSGELSHDDAVMAFYDWSAMTKVKIGSGVHWQRYAYDPDAAEPLSVPVEEGGVLGLVEPVLHSTGAGIIWESAGDPVRIAGLMKASRAKIAAQAGERFAPRGVYCFGDNHGQPREAQEIGSAQLALWRAIKEAGFAYVITSILPGESRILYRDGDFVVLNQAGRWCSGSPFVRGFPDTFAAAEKKLAEANKPGWLVGALDSPIHGSPIYMGRPYGGKRDPQPRLHEYYDYVQNRGATGRVLTATPHTVARYARILEEMK